MATQWVRTLSRPRDVSATAPAGPGLEIETLGGLRLRQGTEDYAAELIRCPVQSRLWLYLLARQARRAGDRITRTALADQLFTGLSPPRGRSPTTPLRR